MIDMGIVFLCIIITVLIIEMKFTYHKNHQVKAYSLVVPVFTVLYNCYHHLPPESFLILLVDSVPINNQSP